MHDPRIGRFFAVDPLAAKYPWNSSYAFSENRVVDGVELEGREHSFYYIDFNPKTETLSLVNVARLDAQLETYFGDINCNLSSGIYVLGSDESFHKMPEEWHNKSINSYSNSPSDIVDLVDSWESADIEYLGLTVGSTLEHYGQLAEMAMTAAFLAGGMKNIMSKALQGKIYKVPGSGTTSGKPYVGKTTQTSPEKRGRYAKDGRDRSKAEVIDRYDADVKDLGSYKEQKAIDANGGVEALDNKRREVSVERMKKLEGKFKNE